MAKSVGDAIRAKLLTYSTVTAYVGQRFYPDVAPQGAALPHIVYYVISTSHEHSISDITRLAHARILIDCVSQSRDTSNNIAHAIRKSGICAFRGTSLTIQIQGVEFDSGIEHVHEQPTDGSQVHRYISSFDLMVHYLEEE